MTQHLLTVGVMQEVTSPANVGSRVIKRINRKMEKGFVSSVVDATSFYTDEIHLQKKKFSARCFVLLGEREGN